MEARGEDMKLIIDMAEGKVEVTDPAGPSRVYPLASPEGFAAVSRAWLRAGWDAKYVYSFSWLGRPVIQLPDDLMRIQEAVHLVRPDVIVETGVAHGGSLIFYATLCKALGRGRVVGVEVALRPANRESIQAHPLADLVTLLDGSSVDPATADQVARLIAPGERVLVILDSAHTKEHVAAELALYTPLVSVGSYIVVTDGIMKDLQGAPRSKPDWDWNNPCAAAQDFLADNPAFALETPPLPFDESMGLSGTMVTYWPGAWLKRVR
jgi:cephalosporin hydroxylase